MTRIQYCALLRGINVGGGNLIKMASLKACLQAAGFKGVATYIQSGNVLFESEERDRAKLTRQLEKVLSTTFAPYNARVIVCSHAGLSRIVREAPKGFGREPEMYRYDVIFLKEPLAAVEALESVRTRDGVDEVHQGPGVLYFSRLTARASQSLLTRIIGLPIYQRLTIRNWNTTTRLLALMQTRG